MKKKMSQREIVLLGLLLLLLIFYFINKGPIQRATDALEAQKMELDNQYATYEPYTTQMAIWQKELNDIFAKYGDDAKSIPDYNNINTIMTEMSDIFDGSSSYSISFSTPQLEEHIVTRNISIAFKVGSYEAAKNKLEKINTSPNRYRISDLSMQSSSDGYNVSVSIIAYEYTDKDEI